MILNSFEVFIRVLLIICSANYAIAGSKSEIFSIISDNVLQRKLTTNLTPLCNSTNKGNAQTEPKRKMTQFLSLASNEVVLTKSAEVNQQKFNLSSLSLPSAYFELSSTEEVLFHDVVYEGFVNFKKSAVTLKTIIPDGSDTNSVKIVYEATKINDIVFTGLAEINGSDYDFILNISQPQLTVEYDQSPSACGVATTKSILQKISFEGFTFAALSAGIVSENPSRSLLHVLADSWLVAVVDTVDHRFVKPRMLGQIQAFHRTYKNDLLQYLCTQILKAPFNWGSIVEDKNLLPSDSSEYEKYIFGEILCTDFSKIENCTSSSMSVVFEENGCSRDNYLAHTLDFAFTYPAEKQPSVSWVSIKNRDSSRDMYGNYRSSLQTKDKYVANVNYWMVRLTVLTDMEGNRTKSDVQVNTEFSLGRNLTKSNSYVDKFFNLFEKSIAKSIKSYVETTLV